MTMPTLEERLKTFWENPENKGKTLMVSWYIAMGMMILGYLIMAYLLFWK
jgi:hypothetical protein